MTSIKHALSDDSDIFYDGCLRVEHNKYYVSCDGKPIYDLTLKEFQILSRLVRENERFVLSQDIWFAGWDNKAKFDRKAANILKVHISALRRKLQPFGIQIVSKPNIGYILSTSQCLCESTNSQNLAGA